MYSLTRLDQFEDLEQMRQHILTRKAAEIEAQLTAWVEEFPFKLLPGERLVFSLRLETGPVVVREDNELPSEDPDLWTLITHERLMALGGSKTLATRAHSGLRDMARVWGSPGVIRKPYCVSDFVCEYPTVAHMRRVPNIGNKSIALILTILKEENVPVLGIDRFFELLA
ncbi:MAG: hypothetical protein JWL88_174 [Parcubacteria group bacterium]|nr:hypothetical protein [Parcubacteria group bacterium]